MAKRRIERILPSYVQSVSAMRDEGIKVAAVYERCREWFKMDLDTIIAVRGPGYSLVDQRGPCRILDCDGSAFFLWSTSKSTPFRPLRTEAGDEQRERGGG